MHAQSFNLMCYSIGEVKKVDYEAMQQTISNAKPGKVSSIYDPAKGGDPLTGKKIVQVGVKIEDGQSDQQEPDSGGEGEEEELELSDEEAQSPGQISQKKSSNRTSPRKSERSQKENSGDQNHMFMGIRSKENSMEMDDSSPRLNA